MFTGIIENLSEIKQIKKEGDNLSISLFSKITNELKIDQSLSHNGVCLTVVDIVDNIYTVTAIKETILKSSIKDWRIGDVHVLRPGQLVAAHDAHYGLSGIRFAFVVEKVFWRK